MNISLRLVSLILILVSFTTFAEEVSTDELVVGDVIVIQNKSTGEWCSPAFSELFASVGFCGYKAGITGSSKFTVDFNGDDELVLKDVQDQVYPMTLLANATVFRYVPPSLTPTSNYAVNVEQQVIEIVGSFLDDGQLVAPEYDRWEVEPSYGITYGVTKHTQGIAITSDGIWVQTQSTGGEESVYPCGGVLQSIDPITERAIHHIRWEEQSGAECDAHTTGIQAVGNVVAVHSFNTGGIPDVRFFYVSATGFLSELSDLKLSLDDGEQYTQVGFVHVKNVGYFLYPKYVGGGKLYFRKDLSSSGPAWKRVTMSGGVKGNDGGNKIVMEAGTGNMYFFALGAPFKEDPKDIADIDLRDKFILYVIKPDLGDKGKGQESYYTPEEFWAAAGAGKLTIEAGEGEEKKDRRPKLTLVGEYFLPGGGWTLLDHRFYFGGDVFVNETGRLDILQAPRDLLPLDLTEFQANYVVIRSKTGKPSNPKTRGRVTRFKVLEESDEVGDDEVYFITNYKKGNVWTSIAEDDVITYDYLCDLLACDELGFEPEPLMDVVSSSINGTIIHLMEDDSNPITNTYPDKLGEIFIPPMQYARVGVHEYTALLTGDGAQYEVTYEVINEGSGEIIINCEAPDGVWYNSDISIQCDWNYPPDLNGTFYLSTNVPDGIETDNAQTEPLEFCILDLTCITVGSKGHHRVDKKPPVMSVTDVTFEATGQLSIVDIGSPSVTDGGSGVMSVTSDTDPLGFPLGDTIITWTATDYVGNTSTETQTVTIVDTTPPVINSLSATPSVLWAPNKKMRNVKVITDVSDIVDENPTCELTDIQISPAITKPKRGLPFSITGADSALLLADRDGSTGDRVYTLMVSCSDKSGNSVSDTTYVTVPHDKRKK